MKIKILILLIGLVSCQNKRAKKPFVIISKIDYQLDKASSYWYEDANGNIENFKSIKQYNVGDTIK